MPIPTEPIGSIPRPRELVDAMGNIVVGKTGFLCRPRDPADLARYLSIVIYGITIQAAGGATRKELRSAAELALRSWPKTSNAKGTRVG